MLGVWVSVMWPVGWAAVPVESVIADFQTHLAKDFKFLHKASLKVTSHLQEWKKFFFLLFA